MTTQAYSTNIVNATSLLGSPTLVTISYHVGEEA